MSAAIDLASLVLSGGALVAIVALAILARRDARELGKARIAAVRATAASQRDSRVLEETRAEVAALAAQLDERDRMVEDLLDDLDALSSPRAIRIRLRRLLSPGETTPRATPSPGPVPDWVEADATPPDR